MIEESPRKSLYGIGPGTFFSGALSKGTALRDKLSEKRLKKAEKYVIIEKNKRSLKMGSVISLLTDSELCLIEQLTYLDEDVARAASDENDIVDFYKISEINKGEKISEILRVFDENALANLRKHTGPVCDAQISGVEWARMITFLKNGRSSSLVLEELMLDEEGYHSVCGADGKSYHYPLALCFSDGSGRSHEAIVAFKGTTGPKEWADNVRAATRFDTPPQRRALGFVEKMAESFGKITVTGHSKGSNKAMYTALMCDKVKRCVGFDGQGFSKVFLEDPEVAERIERRAGLIKNYSLTGDFVHILLYQIPDSHQLFCKGYSVESIGENHAPNSFFLQSSDSSDERIETQVIMVGNTSYVVPKIQTVSEDSNVELLHSFVDCLLTRGENVEGIVEYLAKILPVVIVGEDENGKKYDQKGKLEMIFSDTDSLTALISSLVSFVRENKLKSDYVEALLKAFGIKGLDLLTLLFGINA